MCEEVSNKNSKRHQQQQQQQQQQVKAKAKAKKTISSRRHARLHHPALWA
jgi:hypothetical protein